MNDPSRMMSDSNLLSISWHDSAWIPILGPHNVMDYFSERSNPFYDRTCNNEVLKMQRASHEQLVNMQGIEYSLLFAQEPILYVIRKQHRHSQTHSTPISDYYIIAGTVYQAPDLGSVLNSRVLSAVSHLQSAFEEARGFAKYHPSKGYWWDFKGPQGSGMLGAPPGAKPVHAASTSGGDQKKKAKSREERVKEEPSSVFQRRRVDVLLDILTKKFQPKQNQASLAAPPSTTANDSKDNKDTASVAGSMKSEKSGAAEGGGNDRGVKRDANSANIRQSMQEGKKMKMT